MIYPKVKQYLTACARLGGGVLAIALALALGACGKAADTDPVVEPLKVGGNIAPERLRIASALSLVGARTEAEGTPFEQAVRCSAATELLAATAERSPLIGASESEALGQAVDYFHRRVDRLAASEGSDVDADLAMRQAREAAAQDEGTALRLAIACIQQASS